MNLNDYIADYYIKELKLTPGSGIVHTLKRIQTGIYLFLILNAVTCYYAFLSLFDSHLVALLATFLFEFVFLMIYIVLFATIRKSDFQRVVVNKTLKTTEKIDGVDYPVKKFVLDKSIIETPTIRRWKHVAFRIILLMFLGMGPAVFFGVLIHHRFTINEYESAKTRYIEKQVKLHEKLVGLNTKRYQQEYDSLNWERQLLINKLDSVSQLSNLDVSNQEDMVWLKNRLDNFEAMNLSKINLLKERIDLEAASKQAFEENLTRHYEQASFIQLRIGVIAEKYRLSFILSILFFLYLLLNPFIQRYRLILKRPGEMDIPLENHYLGMIRTDFESYVRKMKQSNAVKLLQSALLDNQVTTVQSVQLKQWLDHFDRLHDSFEDPAIKAVQKPDTRIFVEKGHLGKYLGK